MAEEIALGPQTWSPAWVDEKLRPTFGWQAPGVTERQLFEGSLSRHNALAVFDWDIAAEVRKGLRVLLPEQPDEAERLAGLREQQVLKITPLTPPEEAQLAEAIDALMSYWPPYRLLCEQLARREFVLPTMTFRKYVTGWDEKLRGAEGKPLILKRGIDQMITEEVIAQIDPLMIQSLGTIIYNRMYATGASVEKNSAQPSPSGEDLSTSKETTTRAGNSETIPATSGT